MGRPKKLEPRYLEHKQSGRGRAIYYDANGEKQEELLPGDFNSEESVAAYGRLLLEKAVAPKGAAIPKGERDKVTVTEVLDAFHSHAQRRYRAPDGKPTSKLIEVRLTVGKVCELYGDELARDFSPLKLTAVRQAFVVAGLSRPECNRRAELVRRMFRWAVAQELVNVAVLNALETVDGLKRGETAAREPEPIGPVDDATVAATLPHITSRFVRGLVEFQRLTGCRPGEACTLRLCEVDTTGAVWLYRPAQHKTAHRGKTRTIAIGPRAQAVLKPFLTDDPTAYVFSPALAVAELRAEKSANRKSPRYPSEVKRRGKQKVKNPRRRAATRYSTHAYSVAIARGCDAAFPLPADLAQKEGESRKAWKDRLTSGEKKRVREWRAAHRWHPNQLRHTFATEVRRTKGLGLEAAQAALGHAKADVTQIYAERDEAAAVRVAEQIG